MKIQSVVFQKSVSIESDKVFFREERGEIIFLGRSNVGKSSIMNTIFQKKDMVKTSSKPGKTRLANIFLVNNKYNFTDLPGYGFAKMGREHQAKLDALISWYIEEKRHVIKKAVLLIDSKIWPQESDVSMHDYLMTEWIPFVVVLSKTDRLSKSEALKSKFHTAKVFPEAQIMSVSSHKWDGMKELMKELGESLMG